MLGKKIWIERKDNISNDNDIIENNDYIDEIEEKFIIENNSEYEWLNKNWLIIILYKAKI